MITEFYSLLRPKRKAVALGASNDWTYELKVGYGRQLGVKVPLIIKIIPTLQWCLVFVDLFFLYI